MCLYVCVCMCLCVFEREREREITDINENEIESVVLLGRSPVSQYVLAQNVLGGKTKFTVSPYIYSTL